MIVFVYLLFPCLNIFIMFSYMCVCACAHEFSCSKARCWVPLELELRWCEPPCCGCWVWDSGTLEGGPFLQPVYSVIRCSLLLFYPETFSLFYIDIYGIKCSWLNCLYALVCAVYFKNCFIGLIEFQICFIERALSAVTHCVWVGAGLFRKSY